MEKMLHTENPFPMNESLPSKNVTKKPKKDTSETDIQQSSLTMEKNNHSEKNNPILKLIPEL